MIKWRDDQNSLLTASYLVLCSTVCSTVYGISESRSPLPVTMKSVYVAGAVFTIMLYRLIDGYRPVVIMHGIYDTYTSMDELVEFIKEAHPGTDVYNIDAFNDIESFINMWDQVHGVQDKVAPIFANATDGVNLICYSQGGLICRGFLEAYPDHSVKTLISLSSPQAGQFGDTDYLKFFFPNFTRDNLYLACYTDVGQDVSICNYWNDPIHQAKYQEFSDFLYPLDSGKRTEYKSNFVKLEDLVLIGGPDDGVITPWQSSHFGFYDEKLNVQPYQAQGFYVNDTFGLKTIAGDGRVHIYDVPGVRHIYWHRNRTVFDNYIEPWLK